MEKKPLVIRIQWRCGSRLAGARWLRRRRPPSIDNPPRVGGRATLHDPVIPLRKKISTLHPPLRAATQMKQDSFSDVMFAISGFELFIPEFYRARVHRVAFKVGAMSTWVHLQAVCSFFTRLVSYCSIWRKLEPVSMNHGERAVAIAHNISSHAHACKSGVTCSSYKVYWLPTNCTYVSHEFYEIYVMYLASSNVLLYTRLVLNVKILQKFRWTNWTDIPWTINSILTH